MTVTVLAAGPEEGVVVGIRLLVRRALPLMIVGLLFSSGDSRARAAFPGTNGLIAFNFANRSHIYAVRPDGTGLRKVAGPTGALGVPFSPSWSADGKRLLFVRADRDDTEFAYVDVAARRERQIASTNVGAEPSWAPSGRQLVATEVDDDGYIHISVARDLSASWRPITGGQVIDRAPTWSPRGDWIVFARTTGESARAMLHIVRPNGTGLRALVPGNYPDWSPNGRELVFEREGDIYRVRLDGTSLRRLTRSPRGETQPEWSPDGRRIAFARGTDLMIMNADGSRAHRIARRLLVGTGFDWQPLPR